MDIIRKPLDMLCSPLNFKPLVGNKEINNTLVQAELFWIIPLFPAKVF